MDIQTRLATRDDLDAVASLFDAYRQFYAQPADLTRAREFLRERMRRQQSTILVAERACALVGFTQLYPMFSSVRTTEIWVLNDLYVAATARRQGVASQLLRAAQSAAQAGGATGLMLETDRGNAAARALYRAEGWNEDDSQWYSVSLVERRSTALD